MHEARIGVPFPHAAHLDQLLTLRDQLKQALASPSLPPPSAENPATPEPPAADTAAIAVEIKALLTAQPVTSDPARPTRTAARAERPVTARSRPLPRSFDRSEPPPLDRAGAVR